MWNCVQLHYALFALTWCAHGHSSNVVTKYIAASGVEDTDVAMNDVSLIQTGLLKSHTIPTSLNAKLEQISNVELENCEELHNHESYFTVKVSVGTPPQPFNIVADTGSSSVIVPDCSCKHFGGCSAKDSCFTSDNSTSFLLRTITKDGRELTPLKTFGFGSGNIDCNIASDHVHVKRSHAFMQQSVFLMVNRLDLQISGSFEGILGLGLPLSELDSTPSYMKQAGVERYSLCFNPDRPGALRMDLPALKNPLGNIGSVHWGLELQGMSVGDTKAKSEKVLFCDPASKELGMQTACGAVPDSGTTLMLGPREHVEKLFDSICDNWHRCTEEVAKQQRVRRTSKAMVFHDLLADCSTWVNQSSINDLLTELPPVKMHLAGASGAKHDVTISPWAYIITTEVPVLRVVRKHIFGYGNISLEVPTDETKLKCMPAFETQEYFTKANGPVWIVGAPLFFEHVVSYDLSQTPVAMSIDPGECSACGASLLGESDSERQDSRLVQRSIRHVPKMRYPSIDITQPL